ncbi:MAG: hypothetical protein HQL30_04150, partial [Candidatus Omnitrophica bacterium]|nr:hypothetical protein [Candidatus Omnitrophota bacterium]
GYQVVLKDKGKFDMPLRKAFDNEGNMWVANTNGEENSISVIGSDGQLNTAVGDPVERGVINGISGMPAWWGSILKNVQAISSSPAGNRIFMARKMGSLSRYVILGVDTKGDKDSFYEIEKPWLSGNISALAVSGDNYIYAAFHTDNRVGRVNRSTGEYEETLGIPFGTGVCRPTDLAVDKQGHLFVMNAAGNESYVLALDGKDKPAPIGGEFIAGKLLLDRDKYGKDFSIAIDLYSGRICIASIEKSILLVYAPDGTRDTKFAPNGEIDLKQFGIEKPVDIKVDNDGNLAVTDGKDEKVVTVPMVHKPRTEIFESSTQGWGLTDPLAGPSDSFGNIFVMDKAGASGGSIHVFGRDGQLNNEFGKRGVITELEGIGSLSGRMRRINAPRSMSICPLTGCIYMIDGTDILKLDSKGKYLCEIRENYKNTPSSIAVNSKGQVYVAGRDEDGFTVFVDGLEHILMADAAMAWRRYAVENGIETRSHEKIFFDRNDNLHVFYKDKVKGLSGVVIFDPKGERLEAKNNIHISDKARSVKFGDAFYDSFTRRLYVLEAGGAGVLVFDPGTGNIDPAFGEAGYIPLDNSRFGFPTGLAVDRDGRLIFTPVVAPEGTAVGVQYDEDIAAARIYRSLYLSPALYGGGGSKVEGGRAPSPSTKDRAGNTWGIDGDKKVYKIMHATSAKTVIESVAASFGQLALVAPGDMALDVNENILVMCSNADGAYLVRMDKNERMVPFSTSGSKMGAIKIDRKYGTEFSIAVDLYSKRIFLASKEKNILLIYRPDGTSDTDFADDGEIDLKEFGITTPIDIKFDKEGGLIVTDEASESRVTIPLINKPEVTVTKDQYLEPTFKATDNEGNIYFAEKSAAPPVAGTALYFINKIMTDGTVVRNFIGAPDGRVTFRLPGETQDVHFYMQEVKAMAVMPDTGTGIKILVLCATATENIVYFFNPDGSLDTVTADKGTIRARGGNCKGISMDVNSRGEIFVLLENGIFEIWREPTAPVKYSPVWKNMANAKGIVSTSARKIFFGENDELSVVYAHTSPLGEGLLAVDVLANIDIENNRAHEVASFSDSKFGVNAAQAAFDREMNRLIFFDKNGRRAAVVDPHTGKLDEGIGEGGYLEVDNGRVPDAGDFITGAGNMAFVMPDGRVARQEMRLEPVEWMRKRVEPVRAGPVEPVLPPRPKPVSSESIEAAADHLATLKELAGVEYGVYLAEVEKGQTGFRGTLDVGRRTSDVERRTWDVGRGTSDDTYRITDIGHVKSDAKGNKYVLNKGANEIIVYDKNWVINPAIGENGRIFIESSGERLKIKAVTISNNDTPVVFYEDVGAVKYRSKGEGGPVTIPVYGMYSGIVALGGLIEMKADDQGCLYYLFEHAYAPDWSGPKRYYLVKTGKDDLRDLAFLGIGYCDIGEGVVDFTVENGENGNVYYIVNGEEVKALDKVRASRDESLPGAADHRYLTGIALEKHGRLLLLGSEEKKEGITIVDRTSGAYLGAIKFGDIGIRIKAGADRKISVDDDGDILIAENGSDIVWVIDGDTHLLKGYAPGYLKIAIEGVKEPWKLAMDRDNALYTIDKSDKKVKKLIREKHDSAGFTVVKEFGSFNDPADVVIASFNSGLDDNIFVPDMGDNDIKVFDMNGEPETRFGPGGIIGKGMGWFKRPVSVAVDGEVDHRIFVLCLGEEGGAPYIQVLNSNCEPDLTFPSGSRISGLDIKKDAPGNLFVDPVRKIIRTVKEEFNYSGAGVPFRTVMPERLDEPIGMVPFEDHMCYLGRDRTSMVLHRDNGPLPDGIFPLPSGKYVPGGVALYPGTRSGTASPDLVILSPEEKAVYMVPLGAAELRPVMSQEEKANPELRQLRQRVLPKRIADKDNRAVKKEKFIVRRDGHIMSITGNVVKVFAPSGKLELAIGRGTSAPDFVSLDINRPSCMAEDRKTGRVFVADEKGKIFALKSDLRPDTAFGPDGDGILKLQQPDHEPLSMTVDEGERLLYVLCSNNAVYRYHLDTGGFIGRFPHSIGIRDIASGKEGKYYDLYEDRIGWYNAKAAVGGPIFLPNLGHTDPVSVAVDLEGRIAVAFGSGAIVFIDPDTKQPDPSYGKGGVITGGFGKPYDIGFNDKGDLYISSEDIAGLVILPRTHIRPEKFAHKMAQRSSVDSMPNTVMSADGKNKIVMTDAGIDFYTLDGQKDPDKESVPLDEDLAVYMSEPRNIAVDKFGYIYVTNGGAEFPLISKFSPQGKFIRHIGEKTLFNEISQRLLLPVRPNIHAIDIDDEGNIFIVEKTKDVLIAFNERGELNKDLGNMGIIAGITAYFSDTHPFGGIKDIKVNRRTGHICLLTIEGITVLDRYGYLDTRFGVNGTIYDDKLAQAVKLDIDDTGRLSAATSDWKTTEITWDVVDRAMSKGQGSGVKGPAFAKATAGRQGKGEEGPSTIDLPPSTYDTYRLKDIRRVKTDTDGNRYVLNGATNEIVVYDENWRVNKNIGADGKVFMSDGDTGKRRAIWAFTVDRHNRLLVSYKEHKVVRYASGAKEVDREITVPDSLGPGERLSKVIDITTDDQDKIYWLLVTNSGFAVVLKEFVDGGLDPDFVGPTDAKMIKTFGSGFSFCVQDGAEGKLILASIGDRQISIYNKNTGKYAATTLVHGESYGFDFPLDIMHDQNNNLVVLDSEEISGTERVARVTVIDTSSWKKISETRFSGRSFGTMSGDRNGDILFVGEQGKNDIITVADGGTFRIKGYAPGYLKIPFEGVREPFKLDMDHEGALWTIDRADKKVKKLAREKHDGDKFKVVNVAHDKGHPLIDPRDLVIDTLDGGKTMNIFVPDAGDATVKPSIKVYTMKGELDTRCSGSGVIPLEKEEIPLGVTIYKKDNGFAIMVLCKEKDKDKYFVRVIEGELEPAVSILLGSVIKIADNDPALAMDSITWNGNALILTNSATGAVSAMALNGDVLEMKPGYFNNPVSVKAIGEGRTAVLNGDTGSLAVLQDNSGKDYFVIPPSAGAFNEPAGLAANSSWDSFHDLYVINAGDHTISMVPLESLGERPAVTPGEKSDPVLRDLRDISFSPRRIRDFDPPAKEIYFAVLGEDQTIFALNPCAADGKNKRYFTYHPASKSVMAFNSGQELDADFGPDKNGSLQGHQEGVKAIAVDEARRKIYVLTNESLDQVKIFNADTGIMISDFSPLDDQKDVAVDPRDGKICLLSNDGRLELFSDTGQPIETFNLNDYGISPRRLAVDSEGRVFAAYEEGFVGVFGLSLDGKVCVLLESFGYAGKIYGDFDMPFCIGLNNKGDLYVTGLETGLELLPREYIVQAKPFVHATAAFNSRKNDKELFARGTVDYDGNIYVSLYNVDSMKHIIRSSLPGGGPNTDFGVTGEIERGREGILDLKLSADGKNLIVLENGHLVFLKLDGSVDHSEEIQKPGKLAIDGNGFIYVMDPEKGTGAPGEYRIYKYSPNGKFLRAFCDKNELDGYLGQNARFQASVFDIDADGNFFVMGEAWTGQPKIIVSFDEFGRVNKDFGGKERAFAHARYSGLDTYGEVHKLTINRATGHMFLIDREGNVGSGRVEDNRLICLTRDGRLDTRFGGNGIIKDAKFGRVQDTYISAKGELWVFTDGDAHNAVKLTWEGTEGLGHGAEGQKLRGTLDVGRRTSDEGRVTSHVPHPTSYDTYRLTGLGRVKTGLDGNRYVLNGAGNEIVVYDANWRVNTSMGSNGRVFMPKGNAGERHKIEAFALDRKNRLIVYYEEYKGVRYEPGAKKKDIILPGLNRPKFDVKEVMDIAVDDMGSVYWLVRVKDDENEEFMSVVKCSEDGQKDPDFNGPAGNGNFGRVSSLWSFCVEDGANGNLYLAGAVSNEILVFDKNTGKKATPAERLEGVNLGFENHMDIILDKNMNLLILNSFQPDPDKHSERVNRITVIDPRQAKPIRTVSLSPRNLYSLSLDSNGDILVTDFDDNIVYAVDSDTYSIKGYAPGYLKIPFEGVREPFKLDMDDKGALWTIDLADKKLKRLERAGHDGDVFKVTAEVSDDGHPFIDPRDLVIDTVDEGATMNIFVPDAGDGDVKVFDMNGKLDTRFAGSGVISLPDDEIPLGVAVKADNDGTKPAIFVLCKKKELEFHQIYVFNGDGSPYNDFPLGQIMCIGSNDPNLAMDGITYDQVTRHLHLTNSANGSYFKVNIDNFDRDSHPAEFNAPKSIKYLTDGRIAVLNGENGSLALTDGSGISVIPPSAGGFDKPSGFAANADFDPFHDLYVINAGDHTISMVPYGVMGMRPLLTPGEKTSPDLKALRDTAITPKRIREYAPGRKKQNFVVTDKGNIELTNFFCAYDNKRGKFYEESFPVDIDEEGAMKYTLKDPKHLDQYEIASGTHIPNILKAPCKDITVRQNDGTIYLLGENGKLMALSRDKTWLGEWDLNPHGRDPSRLGVDHEGNIFVAYDAGYIVVFDPIAPTLTVNKNFGLSGKIYGNFDKPYCIRLNKKGDLYVTGENTGLELLPREYIRPVIPFKHVPQAIKNGKKGDEVLAAGTVDADGNIYEVWVETRAGGRSVIRSTKPNGEPNMAFNHDSEFNFSAISIFGVNDIRVLPDGKGLAVLDAGGALILIGLNGKLNKIPLKDAPGSPEIKGPDALAVDDKGFIYILDTRRSENTDPCMISKFSPDGTFIKRMAEKKYLEDHFGARFVAVSSFDVDSDGNFYLFGRLDQTGESRMVLSLNEFGLLNKDFGFNGIGHADARYAGIDTFGKVELLRINRLTGHIFLWDKQDNRVMALDRFGRIDTRFGKNGIITDDGFIDPVTMDISGDGSLCVFCKNEPETPVIKWPAMSRGTLDVGRRTSHIPRPTSNGKPNPGDMTVDSKGRIWVINNDTWEINVYDSNWEPTKGFANDGTIVVFSTGQGIRHILKPHSLAVVIDGGEEYLYVSVSDGKVQKFSLHTDPDPKTPKKMNIDGKDVRVFRGWIEGVAIPGITKADRIIYDPDEDGGKLYFIDNGSNKIVKTNLAMTVDGGFLNDITDIIARFYGTGPDRRVKVADMAVMGDSLYALVAGVTPGVRNMLCKMTKDGRLITFSDPLWNSNCYPLSVTPDPNGAFLAVLNSDGSVFILDKDMAHKSTVPDDYSAVDPGYSAQSDTFEGTRSIRFLDTTSGPQRVVVSHSDPGAVIGSVLGVPGVTGILPKYRKTVKGITGDMVDMKRLKFNDTPGAVRWVACLKERSGDEGCRVELYPENGKGPEPTKLSLNSVGIPGGMDIIYDNDQGLHLFLITDKADDTVKVFKWVVNSGVLMPDDRFGNKNGIITGGNRLVAGVTDIVHGRVTTNSGWYLLNKNPGGRPFISAIDYFGSTWADAAGCWHKGHIELTDIPGAMEDPDRLFYDSESHSIFVSSRSKNVVTRISLVEGVEMSQRITHYPVDKPYDIFVKNKALYAASTGSDSVHVIDILSGEILAVIPASAGGFSGLQFLDLSDNRLLAGNTADGTISRSLFDITDIDQLKSLSSVGRPTSHVPRPTLPRLPDPSDMTIDNEGRIWVVNREAKEIQVYSRDWNLIPDMGDNGSFVILSEDGKRIVSPRGVVMDNGGRLYVAGDDGLVRKFYFNDNPVPDYKIVEGRKIKLIKGDYEIKRVPGIDKFDRIIYDPDEDGGRLYFISGDDNRIVKTDMGLVPASDFKEELKDTLDVQVVGKDKVRIVDMAVKGEELLVVISAGKGSTENRIYRLARNGVFSITKSARSQGDPWLNNYPVSVAVNPGQVGFMVLNSDGSVYTFDETMSKTDEKALKFGKMEPPSGAYHTIRAAEMPFGTRVIVSNPGSGTVIDTEPEELNISGVVPRYQRDTVVSEGKPALGVAPFTVGDINYTAVLTDDHGSDHKKAIEISRFSLHGNETVLYLDGSNTATGWPEPNHVKEPAGMAIIQGSGYIRFFIADKGDNTIKVYRYSLSAAPGFWAPDPDYSENGINGIIGAGKDWFKNPVGLAIGGDGLYVLNKGDITEGAYITVVNLKGGSLRSDNNNSWHNGFIKRTTVDLRDADRICFDAESFSLLVSDLQNDMVTRIYLTGSAGKKIESIPVAAPAGMEVVGNKLFIAGLDTDEVTVYDLKESKVLGIIPRGLGGFDGPSHLWYSGDRLFALNEGDGSVSRLLFDVESLQFPEPGSVERRTSHIPRPTSHGIYPTSHGTPDIDKKLEILRAAKEKYNQILAIDREIEEIAAGPDSAGNGAKIAELRKRREGIRDSMKPREKGPVVTKELADAVARLLIVRRAAYIDAAAKVMAAAMPVFGGFEWFRDIVKIIEKQSPATIKAVTRVMAGTAETTAAEYDERASRFVSYAEGHLGKTQGEAEADLAGLASGLEAGTPRSLIIYAEDILDNAVRFDELENSINDMVKEKNILSGGKIILYSRDEKRYAEKGAEADKLAAIIGRAAPGVEIVALKKWEHPKLFTAIDNDPYKDLNTEVETLIKVLNSAARKGGEAQYKPENILGIIRANGINWAKAKLTYKVKVPVIVMNDNVLGVYRFGDLLTRLVGMRASAAKDGEKWKNAAWLDLYTPAVLLDTEMYANYLIYRHQILSRA